MDVNLSSMSNLPQESYNFINNFGKNPIVLIVLAVIIGAYYLIFALLGNKSSDSNNGSGSIVFVEALLWGVFIIFLGGVMLLIKNLQGYDSQSKKCIFSLDSKKYQKKVYFYPTKIFSCAIPEGCFKDILFHAKGSRLLVL